MFPVAIWAQVDSSRLTLCALRTTPVPRVGSLLIIAFLFGDGQLGQLLAISETGHPVVFQPFLNGDEEL